MADRPMPMTLVATSVEARGFRVPLTFALGTSAANVTAVPLVLVDLVTGEGARGRSYVFCYTTSGARAVAAHVAEAAAMIEGQNLRPQVIADSLVRRYALLGATGTVRIALSALDVALWDALASSVGLPLAEFLGGERRPIRAYDSRGLGLMSPRDLGHEAEALGGSGLAALKLRLGYPTLQQDLVALRTVRQIIGADAPVMVDYNQALTMMEALRRGRALQDEGLAWLEEPIRHDDYRGNAVIARDLAVPLQIGENFNGPEAMGDALAMRACDLVMPDVARIGGVTGWMRAAGLAAAAGIEVSSHLMPELSVHLLAATSTAHWLEYVDWADAILEEPLVIEDGVVRPPDRPGLGIVWSEEKLRHLERIC
jgi:mandelate racemase